MRRRARPSRVWALRPGCPSCVTKRPAPSLPVNIEQYPRRQKTHPVSVRHMFEEILAECPEGIVVDEVMREQPDSLAAVGAPFGAIPHRVRQVGRELRGVNQASAGAPG